MNERGVFMKKTIALVLIVALCCPMFGCSGKMTPVENFLLATKKMDFAAMKAEVLPDETLGSFYLKLQRASSLSEDSLRVLRDLYSLVQYTMGEISSEEGGEKTVSVTLKIPDMERIRTLSEAQILVSGDSAEDVVEDMLANGSVSKSMMKEYTFAVKITEADGGWKIPFGDKANAAFAEALALAEMIDFFDLR